MKKTIFKSLAVIIGLVFSTSSFAAQAGGASSCSSFRYNIVDLGFLGSTPSFTTASALNNSGNVVGSSNVQPFSGHAFYYTDNGGYSC